MRIVLGIAALLGSARTWHAIATLRDRRRIRPPGTLIDVGGRRLHLYSMGEGRPAVVFECGAGTHSWGWWEIQREIAERTRACSYDRAGMGWSDGAQGARTAADFARDLRAVLDGGGIAGPFVLVAHSLGGLFAMQFASEFPDDVAGLVFVDAGTKAAYETVKTRNPRMAARIERQLRLVPLGAFLLSLGVGRVLGRRIYREGPADVRRAQIAHLQPKMVRAMGAEGTAISPDALASARSDPPRDIPVVVLSHGKVDAIEMRGMDADEVEEGWQTLQRDLAAMFDRGEYRQVEGAGHFIQADRPDAVIQAIHDVLDAARR